VRSFLLTSFVTWPLLLGLLVGCSTKSEFEELEPSQAMDRLKALFGSLEPQARLLKQGVHPGNGSEFWVFTSPGELKLPKTPGLEGPSPCPADSVFGFAVSSGVDSANIEPPASSSLSLPQSPQTGTPQTGTPQTGTPQTGTPQIGRSQNSSSLLRGSMWQWPSDQHSIRLRTVPLRTGYLHVVERLVEL